MSATCFSSFTSPLMFSSCFLLLSPSIDSEHIIYIAKPDTVVWQNRRESDWTRLLYYYTNGNVKRRGTTIKELFVDISFVISQDAAILSWYQEVWIIHWPLEITKHPPVPVVLTTPPTLSHTVPFDLELDHVLHHWFQLSCKIKIKNTSISLANSKGCVCQSCQTAFCGSWMYVCKSLLFDMKECSLNCKND
jgi:hypothetical protein